VTRHSIDQALHSGSLSRREVIGLLGVAGTAVLAGGRSALAESAALLARHHSPVGCVVTPSQTEGPYFVDERLERSDVRVDPTNGTSVRARHYVFDSPPLGSMGTPARR